MYLVTLFVFAALVGCESDQTSGDVSVEKQGALAISITRSDISVDKDSPLDNAMLKIYNTNDRLIARYEASEIPDAIYLAAGEYKATVTIDNDVDITTNTEELSYYGETYFTIEGGQVNNLGVNCTLQNIVVAVAFDQSVYDRFEKTVVSYLCLSDEFSMDLATDGSVPTVSFTENGLVYFILPDGVQNISWGFFGESDYVDETTDSEAKTTECSGVIKCPAAATKYTLKFSYTPTPDGSMELTATVDASIDEFNDLFGFSPQPTIDGVDFNLSSQDLIYSGSDYQFAIASINTICDISISSSDLTNEIVVMDDGALYDGGGVSYVATSNTSGVLTLSSEFFCQFNTAGSKTIVISAADAMGSEGFEDVAIGVSGVESVSLDLWNNTAKFSAQVLNESVNTVQVAYKNTNESEWSYVAATKGDGYSYTANVEPTWTEITNESGLTAYNMSGGISANNSYEYKLIVDDAEYAGNSIATATGHTIPNANMESSSIPAFSTSASSSTTWASGNNFFSNDLCAQVSKGGSNSAYLKSKEASNVFAAGNIVFGQFDFNLGSLSGTVGFGQSHTWVSRPRTFKFRYAATIGAETHDDGNRLDGYDKARVYFAIVDWSGRHDVTSGSSGNPSGSWDPVTQTYTEEGNIIGYASLYITESTSTDNLYDVEIPINYYDCVTKPSGSITMIVSCASSAYGDYMTGSTSSRLWVDDFELGY